MLLIANLKTPIGGLNLISENEILLASGFGDLKQLKSGLSIEDQNKTAREVKRITGVTDLINDYFNGDLTALNKIYVRQPGGEFSQRAWKAMRRIRASQVISYSELAKKAGSPAAVRAAGSACAKNLIAVVVPCHRIVKTGGALGNYAYGVKNKEWLLAHEGAL